MHKPHDVRPFALHRVVFMGTWIKKENDKMKKAISILGSTGSIGTQSLEVARSHEMQIYALAANRNVDALEQQAREFLPKKVCIFETEKYAELKQRLADLPVQVLCGMEGLCDIASDKCRYSHQFCGRHGRAAANTDRDFCRFGHCIGK